MDFNHFIQREEGGIHWLVSKALEHPAVLAVSLSQYSAEAFLSVWISNGRDNEALSICSYREGSLSVNFKEIQHSSVNHEGEAISVLSKTLDHESVPPGVTMLKHCSTPCIETLAIH